MPSSLTIRLSGEGGEGILSAGEILARAAVRAGFHVLTYESYNPEVRGGRTWYQLRLGGQPILSPGEQVDLLLSLDGEDLGRHREALAPGAWTFYGAAPFRGRAAPGEAPEEGERLRPIPLQEMMRQAGAGPQAQNMALLGVAAGLLGLPPPILEGLVRERFGKKGQALSANLGALAQGYRAAGEMSLRLLEPPQEPGELVLMSGNEAVALGALAGGCRFFAGYPITPASDIMHLLARELPRAGGTLIQAEDEMAALALALGAAFAGQRAMTATSGPGLSLMVELINLAVAAEVPAVIVDVQRAGPSTGMPTKPEQGDLNLALFGAHGESPRIVLAPTTVEGCFHLTARAFSLAQRYQAPVLLLSDQSLATRRESFPRPSPAHLEPGQPLRPQKAEGYKRYQVTEAGVSPWALPGEEGAYYVATGLEHDEEGRPDYSADNHRRMVAKRFRKLETASPELGDVRRFGSPEPEVGLIGWGSTEGVVREAVLAAQARGLPAAALYPLALSPLPRAEIEGFARSTRRLLVPEMNYTGQMARLLRAELGLEVQPVSLSDPATPGDVLRAIEEAARHVEPARLPK